MYCLSTIHLVQRDIYSFHMSAFHFVDVSLVGLSLLLVQPSWRATRPSHSPRLSKFRDILQVLDCLILVTSDQMSH